MSDAPAADAIDPNAGDPPADPTLITDPNAGDPPADPNDPPADPDAADPPADPNEGKTPEEIEAQAKAKAEADKAVEGAPEAYEEFKMPEGIELDATISDEFKGVAKDLNLSQDQAQKVVNLAAQMRQRDVETIIETRQSWIDETKADKEIGGDKLDATLSVAKRALDAHGSPQFIELLNLSGLGNHPEVVRFMAKVGRTVAEDKVVGGGTRAVPQHHTIANKLFPGSS